MLTSQATIESLGWLVVAEQPLDEAFIPLRGTIELSAIFFFIGLALSIIASVLLARRMVAPIRLLQQGATRIGAGELGHRIAVRTGDELEALGQEFNRTADSSRSRTRTWSRRSRRARVSWRPPTKS